MTAEALLEALRARGVTVEADGGELVIRPASAVPEDLRGELRRRKAAILELLPAGGNVAPATAPAESARMFVPSLDRELWIRSDPDEAARLRPELAADDDDRPVVIADDIVKLASLPTEGLLAAVRGLCAFTGARVASAKPLPDLPEGATGAVYFEFSDGMLISERIFSADAAEPESAEPLVVAAKQVPWSGDADELTAWFAWALIESQLPTEPFQLEPGRRIADPAKWYATLCRDIGAGARGPRAGALVDELRRVRAIVEPNDNPGADR